jgi:hypothetical protein
MSADPSLTLRNDTTFTNGKFENTGQPSILTFKGVQQGHEFAAEITVPRVLAGNMQVTAGAVSYQFENLVTSGVVNLKALPILNKKYGGVIKRADATARTLIVWTSGERGCLELPLSAEEMAAHKEDFKARTSAIVESIGRGTLVAEAVTETLDIGKGWDGPNPGTFCTALDGGDSGGPECTFVCSDSANVRPVTISHMSNSDKQCSNCESDQCKLRANGIVTAQCNLSGVTCD